MQAVTAKWLQLIEAFHDVPLEQLQWWIDNSNIKTLAQDEFLFRAGEPASGTHVLIKGRVRLYMPQKNSVRILGFAEEKEITGYLPYSRGMVSKVDAQAVDEVEVMTFPIEKINELIVKNFELTSALVHVMTSRVREFTTMQQQNEKMMALGKLSAGLAHELNNPASAIVRGSISLKQHLQLQPETFKEVISIKMTAEEVEIVNNKMFEVLRRKEKPILTLMQRMALEDDLAECLDGHGVKNSTELAENFIEFGFTCEDMNEFSELVPPAYLSPVLNWINNNLVTEKMVNDIQESSQRIEKLVSAIKNFTHMDRDRDKEYTDIHSGIKNTLTMLEYKFKKGNVKLVEDYDVTLPKVKAFVGELNQVWTNLLDNALDAMEVNSQGKLEIKTIRDGGFIKVSITDDGPGVPDDIQSQIFDPFFTTKEIGKGTGLGLDVVTRIIRQHDGSVELDSIPGKTTFEVRLPIDDL
ncbi:sensor histidine kinase [Segetibacter aerophilus]|uniref:histidine kinase n=1 Tax=Segetibacter aerophilus TaxID=670293 RepID=A0A512BIX7_9BACT|nr:ATP-binding protein [Segetibacter aerophilus]GEO11921.1 sensor histidine kinase [Segetibacter aerophilus]